MKIVYLFPNNNKEKTANRIQTIKFTNAMANVLENKFLFISGNGYRQNRWHIQLKYLFNRFHTLQFLFFVLLKKYITQNDILYIRDYKLLKYISFLKKITDSGFLYGFEIINSNFLSIKKMLDETSYKNFEIINKALSDKKKSITFIKNCDLPKLAEDGKIEIQSTTIDLFLSGKKVDLIKLDVNGDEYNVLAISSS